MNGVASRGTGKKCVKKGLNAVYPMMLGNSSLRLATASRIESPTKASTMPLEEWTTMPTYSLVGVRCLASQL